MSAQSKPQVWCLCNSDSTTLKLEEFEIQIGRIFELLWKIEEFCSLVASTMMWEMYSGLKFCRQWNVLMDGMLSIRSQFNGVQIQSHQLILTKEIVFDFRKCGIDFDEKGKMKTL